MPSILKSPLFSRLAAKGLKDSDNVFIGRLNNPIYTTFFSGIEIINPRNPPCQPVWEMILSPNSLECESSSAINQLIPTWGFCVSFQVGNFTTSLDGDNTSAGKKTAFRMASS